MDVEIGDTIKKDLLGIDTLDGLERKRFLRGVFNAALKDFACKWVEVVLIIVLMHSLVVTDVPECPTKELACLQNAVITLFTVSVKHGFAYEEIQSFLKRLGVQDAAAEDLLDSYKHSKDDIAQKLAKHGHDIPLVTNLNWKLSSILRSSGNEDLQAELVYKVTLEGADDQGGRSIITSFNCTIEELQNLTGKFKEIERHCQKVANHK